MSHILEIPEMNFDNNCAYVVINPFDAISFSGKENKTFWKATKTRKNRSVTGRKRTMGSHLWRPLDNEGSHGCMP